MTEPHARFGTPERRWAGVGPYYAMFPAAFAARVIRDHTDEGDVVLDPFAGRGTALYEASIARRHGLGGEINPVGWVYTRAKLEPADRTAVEHRLEEIATDSHYYRRAAKNMSPFFQRCYSPKVREFLLTARNWLNWRQSKVDRTLMALLLVHLHGKRTDSFSNQMGQTKAMSPPYAMQWWKQHDQKPPHIDPLSFMRAKLDWRYAKGVPATTPSSIYLGDSAARMNEMKRRLESLERSAVRLLLTSPPYCGITNYHYDQWLRLWMLGGPTYPGPPKDARRGRFIDRGKYRALLTSVFARSRHLLDDKATVYVRTDGRSVTRNITMDVLKDVFTGMTMREYKRPMPEKTQTNLFGGAGERKTCGEVDIVLVKP
jgi:hypothetical protein